MNIEDIRLNKNVLKFAVQNFHPLLRFVEIDIIKPGDDPII